MLSNVLEIDYTELYGAYSRKKKICAVSPKNLLKILVYAYMNNIYSSRQIELACKRDINYTKKFTSHPDYDKMLSLLVKRGVPLLLHANNPVECWAKSNEGIHPGLALYQGSALGAFADYETIYRETLTMLDKHPKLNIVIAHFFFLSSNMDRAKFVLEKYPNLRLDITPGTDMYFHFMKCPEKWHDFSLRKLCAK